MNLILRKEAERELEQVYHWYERQQAGLGKRFYTAFEDVLERIRDSPLIYVIIHRDIRKALLHDFPYDIYFLIRGDDLIVLRILHQHRLPITFVNN